MDTAMEVFNNRTFQYWFTSEFKALMEENRKQLEMVKKNETVEGYQEAYRKYEKDAFESFEGRCWSADADISEIGHKIRAYGSSAEFKEVKIKHCKFDPSLSVFANMVIRRMQSFEHQLYISTAHKHLFLILYGRLDAYRNSNDLHFNICADGPPGVSKTFLYEIEEKLSIDGTVEAITYQTLRADAIDRDNNDTIVIMNEIPR